MPHTSHRHRHPANARPQRTKTTDANGWTTIQHGPNPTPPPRRPPPPESTSQSTHASTSPAPSPSEFQALTTTYAHQQHVWANSQSAARLRAIVAERVRRNDVTMVENCVVLGLGSLGSGSAAGSAAGPGAARKSLLQLAALEDLLGCLSSRFPALREAVYAQDPAFSVTDVAFLETRGVKVLEAPGASERVGSGTVLYAPHCIRVVYLDALSWGSGKKGGGGTVGGVNGEDGGVEGDGGEGGPVLVVGNEVGELIDGTLKTPPSMTRIGKAFLDADRRRSVAFPRFEADETVFWNMWLYWREDAKEESMEHA